MRAKKDGEANESASEGYTDVLDKEDPNVWEWELDGCLSPPSEESREPECCMDVSWIDESSSWGVLLVGLLKVYGMPPW